MSRGNKAPTSSGPELDQQFPVSAHCYPLPKDPVIAIHLHGVPQPPELPPHHRIPRKGDEGKKSHREDERIPQTCVLFLMPQDQLQLTLSQSGGPSWNDDLWVKQTEGRWP